MNILQKIQATKAFLIGEGLTPCVIYLSTQDRMDYLTIMRNLNPNADRIETIELITVAKCDKPYSRIQVVEDNRIFDINNDNEEIL